MKNISPKGKGALIGTGAGILLAIVATRMIQGKVNWGWVALAAGVGAGTGYALKKK